MTLSIEPGVLVGFVLALLRASAWLAVAPPFNSNVVPVKVKIGLAAALAISVAPRIGAQPVDLDTASLLTAAFLQVAIGLALGFVAQVLLSALQAAGGLIDLFGGFTISTSYDPLSLAQTSVFGRAYQLFAMTILFAIDGHLLLVRGFLTSFTAVPLSGPDLGALSRVVVHDVGLLFVSAVQIAAPLLAALFLAEVALGLLARAAPQMNPFMLGFPLKILLTLLLVGAALPLLPDAVSGLLHDATRSTSSIVRTMTGGG